MTRQFGGLAQRDLELEQDDAAAAGLMVAPRSGVHVSDRAAGPVGDPNRYAQILLVLLPLAALRFRTRRASLAQQGHPLLCAGLLLGGVVLSYSRGAFVTLAVMIVLLMVVGLIRLSHVARRSCCWARRAAIRCSRILPADSDAGRGGRTCRVRQNGRHGPRHQGARHRDARLSPRLSRPSGPGRWPRSVHAFLLERVPARPGFSVPPGRHPPTGA